MKILITASTTPFLLLSTFKSYEKSLWFSLLTSRVPWVQVDALMWSLSICNEWIKKNWIQIFTHRGCVVSSPTFWARCVLSDVFTHLDASYHRRPSGLDVYCSADVRNCAAPRLWRGGGAYSSWCFVPSPIFWARRVLLCGRTRLRRTPLSSRRLVVWVSSQQNGIKSTFADNTDRL